MSINMFRDTINGGIASLFISERQAIYLKVTASWATKTIKTRVVEIRGSRVRLDEVIDIEYPGIETFRAEMEVPLIEISVMRDMGKKADVKVGGQFLISSHFLRHSCRH